ncbi:carbohydrate kinase family protein [Leeuwenhoekiella marinoflava]|uniref:Fructokinase n=2 Tax=Leeuwenhoekiella marinoflava TaxID=988 RepID=A0A4Q0PKZ6_9FLAO|nr:carbohydrate kinase [Leeuwenhoekiella marinoflava]RXG27422.1 fructokinase [Leeuwenhoekiella marinoflava]SHF69528.1 fructokinase [Leeuwenhoekiella marinoflava DSM 3653]
MKDMLSAISYGEILWDVFPDGKALGGAPLNLCLRLKSLGLTVKMISRLGSDPLAEETRTAIEKFDLDQSLIQEDNSLETGQVLVNLDSSGSASYTIKEPVAWDAIASTESNKKAVSQTDLFIFGSLAARSETSRNTLKELLAKAKYAIFDVNLRAPHYKMEHLIQFMKQADMIKMNDEELEEIAQHLDIKSQNISEQIEAISKHTNTSLICVTCGSEGAILYQDGKIHKHSGYKIEVVDTVGAGDSFLAGLIYQLVMVENNAEKSLAFACALGSLVAGKKGANAKISKEKISEKMAE